MTIDVTVECSVCLETETINEMELYYRNKGNQEHICRNCKWEAE